MPAVPAIIGAAGALGSAAISARGARAGARSATYNPTNVTLGPFGGIQGYRGGDGRVNYTSNLGQYQQFLPGLQGLARGLNNLGPLIEGTGGFSGLNPAMFGELGRAQDALGSPLPESFFGSEAGFRGMAGDALGLSRLGAGGVLDAFGDDQFMNLEAPEFDLDAATQQEFSRLNELAAPGEMSATQRMFNGLQASGRLGLTQNGELGDLGGLDLSQRLARTDRLGAARSSARDQQRFLQDAFAQNTGLRFQGAELQDALRGSAVGRYGDLSTLAQGADEFGFNRLLGLNNLSTQNALARFGLVGDALNLGQSNLQSQLSAGFAGLQGMGSIQDQLRAMLESSIGASSAQAGVGAARGQIQASGANNLADILGNITSGIVSNWPQNKGP